MSAIVFCLAIAGVVEGDYVIADRAGANAAVDAAVEGAASGIVFFLRPFAMPTLREAIAVSETVAVRQERRDGRELIVVTFGGTTVTTVAGAAVDANVDAHGAATVR